MNVSLLRVVTSSTDSAPLATEFQTVADCRRLVANSVHTSDATKFDWFVARQRRRCGLGIMLLLDGNWVQDCRWRCLCHESRCCGGLHTAAGCRAWSRVSVCSAQSTDRARHWQWSSLLNVNDDQSTQRDKSLDGSI